jgi:hypothetical protein
MRFVQVKSAEQQGRLMQLLTRGTITAQVIHLIHRRFRVSYSIQTPQKGRPKVMTMSGTPQPPGPPRVPGSCGRTETPACISYGRGLIHSG